MKDTKLIQILRTFSNEELKQFEKFISSPYHNSGKNCTPLFKLLRKSYPEFAGDKLTYENLYIKLYPGKKFNKQVMWNLASAMEKLLTEFLIQQRLNRNKFEKHTHLMDEYFDRKLYGFCTKELEKMENHVLEQKIDSAFFSNRATLEEYKKEYNLREDKQHLVCENVLYKGESLILNFIIVLSEIISDLDANHKMYNARFDFNIPFEFIKNTDLKKTLDYVKKHRYEYSYIMELYYYTIMVVIEPGEENFNNLKRIFEENKDKLTFLEKHSITGKLVNFCTMNSQMPGIRKVLFEINNYRLKEDLVFHPGNQMPKIVYIQMLINALSLNETKWAENFIETCTPRLNPETRDAMRALANAYLNAALNRYDKVLDFLNKVEYVDVRDKVHVKILTAESYYELQQTETLLSFIDTSRHFLKNNENVNDTRKQNYINFFNILHKLVSAREHPSPERISLLKNEILNTKVNAKGWLTKKIEELELLLQ
jgi:hypothetical protein